MAPTYFPRLLVLLEPPFSAPFLESLELHHDYLNIQILLFLSHISSHLTSHTNLNWNGWADVVRFNCVCSTCQFFLIYNDCPFHLTIEMNDVRPRFQFNQELKRTTSVRSLDGWNQMKSSFVSIVFVPLFDWFNCVVRSVRFNPISIERTTFNCPFELSGTDSWCCSFNWNAQDAGSHRSFPLWIETNGWMTFFSIHNRNDDQSNIERTKERSLDRNHRTKWGAPYRRRFQLKSFKRRRDGRLSAGRERAWEMAKRSIVSFGNRPIQKILLTFWPKGRFWNQTKN